MAYRRTENVIRRLAAREQAILDAARAEAANGGMSAVQIVPVALRAGVATGTVYRYFPAKADLVSQLVASVAERELDAMREAADAAPGPLSALAAAIATFASRTLSERKLAWAVLAEASDPEADAARRDFRAALSRELQQRITVAVARGYLPQQDVSVAAPATLGALLEGLIGPLAPDTGGDATKAHELVQTATLLCLRALGLVDARALGLVAQLALGRDNPVTAATAAAASRA
jgi:AcrR family transcriptional regulator